MKTRCCVPKKCTGGWVVRLKGSSFITSTGIFRKSGWHWGKVARHRDQPQGLQGEGGTRPILNICEARGRSTHGDHLPHVCTFRSHTLRKQCDTLYYPLTFANMTSWRPGGWLWIYNSGTPGVSWKLLVWREPTIPHFSSHSSSLIPAEGVLLPKSGPPSPHIPARLSNWI